MDPLPDEVITIKDVAAYLHIPVPNTYKLAQKGRIPGTKFGKHWRFKREVILRLIPSRQPRKVFDEPR